MCFNCDSKKKMQPRLQREQLFYQGLPYFWHIVKVVCSSVYQIQMYLCDVSFCFGGGGGGGGVV